MKEEQKNYGYAVVRQDLSGNEEIQISSVRSSLAECEDEAIRREKKYPKVYKQKKRVRIVKVKIVEYKG
jgi:hypothetical protein